MNNETTDNNPSTAAVYLQGTDVQFRNTIVALSTNLDVDLEQGTVVTFDYSLVQIPAANAVAALTAGTDNISGIDPLLGTLADNGGATFTMLPTAESPVINAGEPAFAALSTDQRGENRVSGGRLDIGAAEVQQGLADTGPGDSTPMLVGGNLLALVGSTLAAVSAARRRTS